MPWLVNSAITSGESNVAATVRKPEPSTFIKPGGFQPVRVVLHTTTFELTETKKKSPQVSKRQWKLSKCTYIIFD